MKTSKDLMLFEDEDDEFDIIELLTSSSDELNQYLIFNGANDELYAINISKVKELVVYKNLNIANNTSSKYIEGTASIRGNMIALVNFDRWFGNSVLDKNEYEFVVLIGSKDGLLGLIVKSIENIITINFNSMVNNSINNEKTTFISEITVNHKKSLCSIFDSDKMFLDVFGEDISHKMAKNDTLISNKSLFFADDSILIRKSVEKLLQDMNLKYYIYKDGSELLDAIFEHNIDDIGIIITDIEMPKCSGSDVIKKLRSNHKFNEIDIIVHTNMATSNTISTLLKIGASRVIAKIDMPKLSDCIKELIRK